MQPIQEFGILLICFAGALSFRHTKLAYPLMLCLTLIHESCHALAVLITGGKVHGITVYSNGSGLTVSLGGNKIIILCSGYLGSLAFGYALLWLSYQQHIDLIFSGLALMLVVIALFLVATWFTQFVAIGIGLILILLANFAPIIIQLIFLRFISACLVFYSIFDLHLVIIASQKGELSECDLVKLSLMTKMPIFVWAFIWILFASICQYALLKFLLSTN